MKTRQQISIAFISTIIGVAAICLIVAVGGVEKRGRADIEAYRSEQINRTKRKLKNMVDMAYVSMDSMCNKMQDREFLEKHYGGRLKDIIDTVESTLDAKVEMVKTGKISLAQAQKQAIEELSKLRYNNGTGYVWINDMAKPYPNMIMHATIPELDGTVLDNPKFDCALGVKRNLFAAFVDVCSANGEGFVDYLWPKPTKKGLIPDVPKLSYVRLFKEWGWVVGTGIYIDDAFEEAAKNCILHLKGMRYDDGVGYFWLNDMGKPYPKMIMHATIPALDGKILDDPKFDCALGVKRNLFAAFVDVCGVDGEGYVDYLWPKPKEDGTLSEPVEKISYGRLYEPRGWVIGSGAYVDMIEGTIALKTAEINKHISELVTRISFASALALFIAILVASVLSKRLTDPILNLVAAMHRIRNKGLVEEKVSLSGSTEIREAGEIFNEMLIAITDGVRKLTETTAAKERFEKELSIARDIQMSILPRIVPPLPSLPEFSINASIDPAKEVGGDFYDFFFMDKDHFCFAIGDVSGKGVPASLFMAVTKTLLKASTQDTFDSGEILTRVNRELAHDNDSCMFVTLFCSVMNVRTGEIVYANAGHNPPYIIRKDGDIEEIPPVGEPVVGAVEDVVYSSKKITLRPGDRIFTYTDGVTEAMNEAGELFGEERLEKALDRLRERKLADILSVIRSDLKAFAKDAVQSDDITMLAVKYKGIK